MYSRLCCSLWNEPFGRLFGYNHSFLRLLFTPVAMRLKNMLFQNGTGNQIMNLYVFKEMLVRVLCLCAPVDSLHSLVMVLLIFNLLVDACFLDAVRKFMP